MVGPVLFYAFGCLSKGLAYIHSHNICHNDIKPANILYEKAFDNHGARLLWADFGLAYDFSATGNSKTRTTRVYSCDMLRLKLQRHAPDSFLDEQPMSSQILTEFLRVLKNWSAMLRLRSLNSERPRQMVIEE